MWNKIKNDVIMMIVFGSSIIGLEVLAPNSSMLGWSIGLVCGTIGQGLMRSKANK